MLTDWWSSAFSKVILEAEDVCCAKQKTMLHLPPASYLA